ncbi:hypothetical protein SAMN05428970_3099 [Agromyces sp. CF514]|uniref:hypothetical protein n=1 Tax=Agromyces sp. CF514 TaxID=1881031 RepID=UPI0008E13691|nr:hypothetical protein [Agromyces sp. CF514]SFR85015.1 hypothetical protein SAMN05428970_3099 [Agromyces sp. CF514]
MHPLAGDPVVLRRTGQRYAETASAIRDAVATLDRIAEPSAMVSVAVDRVRADAERLSHDIAAAERRYGETGDALVDYAAALERAQDDADRAIHDAQDAQEHSAGLQARERALQSKSRALPDDAPDADLRALQRSISSVGADLDRSEAAAESARRRWEEAVADRDRAARIAIDRIRGVVDGSDLNDSFWDDLKGTIGAVFEAIGDVLRVIAAAVVAAVMAVVEAVIVLVAAVLVVIAAIVLLGLAVVAALIVAALAIAALLVVVVAAALLAFVAIALIAGLLLVTAALVLLVAAAIAVILAAVVGLAVLLLSSPLFWALVLSAVTLLGLVLAWRVAIEIFAPTPEVTPFEPGSDESRESHAAWEDANAVTEIDSLDDLVMLEGLSDSMGGESQTVVDIVRMEGEPARYIVTLPSTQDWQVAGVFFGQDMNGDGAVNDLDTNIVLRLFPDVRTQYERAVLDAMTKAGIGPDDPVLLVGFSQGGILAGHLAANRSDAFNFEGVVAYGAPIDDMAIPSKTTVVSMQHEGDIVHQLDLTGPPRATDTWTTYSRDVPPGVNPSTGEPYSAQPHNNVAYQQTARDLLVEDPTIDDGLAQFFGTVDDSAQYTFAE